MRSQAFLDCDLCTQGSNECHALNHILSEIQSVEHGLHDDILLAIPLGKSQFDLAVAKTSVKRIRDHFTDQSHWHLLSSDPLFAAELGRSYPETAFGALTQMRRQYDLAANSIRISNDPRFKKWFKAETNRIENLLEYYWQRCVNMAYLSSSDSRNSTAPAKPSLPHLD